MKFDKSTPDNGSDPPLPGNRAEVGRSIATGGTDAATARNQLFGPVIQPGRENLNTALEETTAAEATPSGRVVSIPSANPETLPAVTAAPPPESPPVPEQPFSAFGSISQFRDAQRMAS